MEKALARRYRPRTFAEVIGQDAVVRTLANAIASGRVAHGFIFSGHRGIGKTSVARVLAKAMNCRAAEGPTATPCGSCVSCQEIGDGNCVDVIEIDAASNRGIDEIRALRESVRYRPARDRYKIYILDEAHQLTDDAFNALLKTLEEPPEWVIFVLATTEPEALPATIRSRCQHFAFRAVPYRQIVARLAQICEREGVAADADSLSLLAESADGSLRDGLSLLDQAIAHGAGRLEAESTRALLGRAPARRMGELLAAVAASETRAPLEALHAMLAAGVTAGQICRQLVFFVRNALLLKIAGVDDAWLAMSESEKEAAKAAGESCGEEDLTRFLQILLRAAGELRYAQEPQLHLELAILKMAQARRLATVEEVIAALKKDAEDPTGAGERAAGGGSAAPPRAGRQADGGAASPPSDAGEITKGEATADGRPAGAEAAGSAAASGGEDARSAVLRVFDEQKKAAWRSIVERAHWNWEGQRLELVFSGATAPLAALADQDEVKRGLRAACQAVSGASPEIAVRIADESAPPLALAPAPAPGDAARRAAAHPVLRQLRELIPARVLRTSDLRESD